MHQYKVDIFKHNTDGSLSERCETKYADDTEATEIICREYDVYQTIADKAVMGLGLYLQV